MSDEPEKPKPRGGPRTLHEMRATVSARHKIVASGKPLDEAIALLREHYPLVDERSCRAFALWLKGEEDELSPSRVAREPKNAPLERIHVAHDPETGDPRFLDTVPGSIPPRPGT